MKRALIFSVLVVIFLFKPLNAQSIYQDERFLSWRSSLQSGQLSSLLKSVEADLSTQKPHSLSASIWIVANKKLGNTGHLAKKAPSNIKKRIALAFDAQILTGNEFLSRYSSTDLQNGRDLNALVTGIKAYTLADPQKAIDLTYHGLQQYGPLFLFLQTITEMVEQSVPFRKLIEKDLQSGYFDQFPIAKKYLASILAYLPISNHFKFKALNDYLKTYPNDPVANYAKAILLKNRSSKEEVLEHFALSFQLDPFYKEGHQLIDQAAFLWNLDRKEEAESIINNYTKLFHSSQRNRIEKITWANVLNTAGFRGRARELLWEINPSYPTDPDIQYLLGSIELASNRINEAADHFSNATHLRPYQSQYYLLRCQAYYTAGKYNEALSVLEDFAKYFRNFPMEAYIKKAAILEELQDYSQAAATLEAGVKNYPFAGALLQKLADVQFKNKNYSQALSYIKMALDYDYPNKESINLFVAILTQQNNISQNQIITELRQLSDKFPWSENLWQKIASYKRSDSQKWAVWEEATKANPDLFFPYRNIIAIFAADNSREQVKQILDIAINDLSQKSNPSQLALVYLERALFNSVRAENQTIDQSLYIQSKNDLDKFIELGGSPSIYYQSLAKLEAASNQMAKARNAIQQAIQLQPDKYDFIQLLRSEYKGKSQGATKLYDWFMRDPYESQRSREFIQFNIEEDGSPINALAVMFRYGYDWKNLKNKAYQKLGDYRGYFLDSYARATSLSPNDNQINLYHTARLNSWNDKINTEVDYTDYEAKITLEDGTIILRKDDMRTGKVKKLQIGSTKMEINYNQSGLIKNIVLPHGKSIQFFHSEDGEIHEIINSQREKIGLVFDQSGRPIRIKWQGHPEIQIQYDNFGKIKSFNGDETQKAKILYQKVEHLLTLPESLNQVQSYLLKGTLPDLNISDQNYDILKSAYTRFADKTENKGAQIPLLDSGIAFADHLIKNAQVNEAYVQEAVNILTDLFIVVQKSESITLKNKGLNIIDKFHELNKESLKGNLPGENWKTWQGMQEWLSQERKLEGQSKSFLQKSSALSNKIEKEPLQLLPSEQWLKESPLNNEALWGSLFFEPTSSGAKITAWHFLSDNHYLVGTNNGLYIYKNGRWQLVEYNPANKTVVRSKQIPKTNEYNHITAIEEDAQGNIYLATPKGVLALNQDIFGSIRVMISDQSGLPSNTITGLSYLNEALYIGTNKGLIKNNAEGILKQVEFPEVGLQTKVHFLTTCPNQSKLLVGTSKGLFLLNDQQIHHLGESAEDGLIDSEGQIFVLRNQKVYHIQEKEKKYTSVMLVGNYIKSKKVEGLISIPIQEKKAALGVITDKGIDIYHRNHFELFIPPIKSEKTEGAFNIFHDQMQIILTKGKQLLQYNPIQNSIIKGKIEDILTIDQLEITAFIINNKIQFLKHDESLSNTWPLTDTYLDKVNSFTLDLQNRIVFNDGNVVRRASYNPNTGKFLVETLFNLRQYEPSDNRKIKAGKTKNILVSKDGTIWVCTELSLFRYQKDKLTEFNYFRNPSNFPVKSNSLHRVIETDDHQILLVASENKNLTYRGIELTGGLYEWSPKQNRFNQITIESDQDWFFHSFTPISSNEVIISTNTGFQLEKDGKLEVFDRTKNPSYFQVKRTKPSLFLGTKGISYGNHWLFGCAAGILTYKDGKWAYPEKLNRLLPDDQHLKRFGSRYVNSINADQSGNLYVGTDRGLLIYKPEGASFFDLITTNLGKEKAYLSRK